MYYAAALIAISANFRIESYTVGAASRAAVIQSSAHGKAPVDRSRHCVKADCQVIASAIEAEADAIVTGNVEEFTRLAAGRIKIIEVPDPLPEQMPMDGI